MGITWVFRQSQTRKKDWTSINLDIFLRRFFYYIVHFPTQITHLALILIDKLVDDYYLLQVYSSLSPMLDKHIAPKAE